MNIISVKPVALSGPFNGEEHSESKAEKAEQEVLSPLRVLWAL